MKLKIYTRIIFVCYIFTMYLLYKVLGFRPAYGFMILNVTLAYIPFELSLLIEKQKNKLLLCMLSLIWLLFYPNAAYLLTDFFHVEALNIYVIYAPFNAYLNDWFAFSLLTSGILFGFSVGLISLYKVSMAWIGQLNLKNKLTLFTSQCVIALLSGFAIYLGRFSRLHTHYLFSDPLAILKLIVSSVSLQSICFAVMMAIWQLIIIYLFVFFKKGIKE